MGVGTRIKELLRSRGMTIKQLSALSGVSINTLYSITKRDSKRVDAVILRQLAAALGVHWLDLAGDGHTDRLESDREFTHAWDHWLAYNGVAFTAWQSNGVPGLLVSFTDSGEAFFLTREQAEQLPKDGIAAVKALIRSLGSADFAAAERGE